MPKSNTNRSLYRDPITGVGVRLGAAESFSFHLHEAGCMKFATAWNHPNARGAFWRLYWCGAPGAWIDCAGQRVNLEPNVLLLVPSHTPFDTHGSLRPYGHFWIHFSLYPDLTAWGGQPIRVSCNKELARRVAAVARKTAQAGPASTREIYHLCSGLLHQAFADPAISTHPPRLPPRLLAILDEIESSLSRPIPVDELARRAGMSRGGFIRWFRQRMEISPARYALGRRIDHACRMLKFSSATIEAISDKLGFANRDHFSRAFQRRMGLGPAAFRRN